MRLLIAGGGGFRVPLIYRALASGRYAGVVTELVLHDVDPARLDAIMAVVRSMPEGIGGRVPVRSATSLPEALPGAEMVFAAIRPGGTAGRVADEKVAQRLGLLGQETTGAGGISYALRTIPPMLHLARLMKEHCPHAWLVNFTNPAGMVTEALLPVLGRRVIGICDSAGGLVQRAARAAGVALPEGRLDGVGYYGLNHLGWLYRLESGGRDVLPELLSDPRALASFEEGRLFPQPFLARLGSLPNEYLYYYYRGDAARQAMRAMARTRGETIHDQQQELYPRLTAAGTDAYRLWEGARLSREEGYLAEARGKDEQRDQDDLAGGGYERVALATMQALSGAGDTELILNTRNSLPAATQAPAAEAAPPQAAIPGLPADAVVEVPCVVTTDGALPLAQELPPEPQLGLLRQVKEVERLTVRAATYGDREAALEAFARHPLVGSHELAVALLAGYEQEFPALRDLWGGGGR
ncbi:6-phospho-beta-glucosidase [Pseudarthrobacter phenanthrenivorans]|uniref:6-phospho-beta-glucosidase n=1 Tax=Pseudarthrobacter phenanthrenivorans TaxID=361575 RepID=A0A3B0FRR1_PSEPS|nr:6-phospho-beta-glucosidase [Pseudarthrobacter phenanthrenivorans]RKO25593.1 6-phospho-beta-glucosidase [Pseudarthrobacter phenanthrenivorans]